MATISIDPALFRDDAILPDTAAMNARLADIFASAPSILDIGHLAVRARRRASEGLLGNEKPDPDATWMTATWQGRQVQVRVFRPGAAHPAGVLLHIHGGGHTLGGADAQDQMLSGLARRLGIVVVSVDYRLAPEHPWPHPADDCETAARWLIWSASALFGTDRLLIMGDSAGAHLSAITLLRVRDGLGRCPFIAANLIYGVFDMGGTPSTRAWGERILVISTPIVTYFNNNLLPPDQFDLAARQAPAISPLYADLRDLCPALFTIGTADPLVDDSLFMASRWAVAGNHAELAVYPGGVHAFIALPDLTITRQAWARMDTFLATALAAAH